jgi:hypothetical protein
VKEFVNDDGVAVRGDGVHDDTTGIQKAINLFLANRADPNLPQSGIVYLPTGTYRITAPLVVPSGVVLLGDGSGTAIKYTGSGGVAIRFDDPSGTVTNAGVENLCVGADNAGGIGDVLGVPVVGAALKDLVFNVSGWGIDLHDVRQSTIDNVHQKKLGTGSVRVVGDHTSVRAVNTEFGVRAGFAADPALVVVKGDYNSVTDCVIEGVPSGSAHGIYLSGTGVRYSNNWIELNGSGPLQGKDKIAVIFDHLRDARIDNVFLLTSSQRAQFIDSQATFTMLDTNAEQWPLTTVGLMDATTVLKVEFAISRAGLGDTGLATVVEQLVLTPGGSLAGGVWSARAGYGVPG